MNTLTITPHVETEAFTELKRMVESLNYSQNFSHEDFFSWTPEQVKHYIEGLFTQMTLDEELAARNLIDIDNFDFTIVLQYRKPHRAQPSIIDSYSGEQIGKRLIEADQIKRSA